MLPLHCLLFSELQGYVDTFRRNVSHINLVYVDKLPICPHKQWNLVSLRSSHGILRGRGLATEGTQAALRYGFTKHALPRIIGATVPEHAASRRVMEKCGLSYQGELWFRHARIAWYALDAFTWRQLSREQK
jgi:RimJ/RimL family protein N-acetyltransferase